MKAKGYTNFLGKPENGAIGKMKAEKGVSVTIPNGNREPYISLLSPKAPLKTLLYHHTQNARKVMVTESHKSGFIHQIKVGARSSARTEHRAFNPGVGGSTPPGPATKRAVLNLRTLRIESGFH